MVAYLVLFLAALSRFVPHVFHGIGFDFTAVGGGLLFFGSRRSRWQAIVAAAAMGLTDVYLTCGIYGYPFHLLSYLPTWAWYAAASLLGTGLLRRITVARVTAAGFASTTSFFIVSNCAVWAVDGLYPHSMSGLMTCFRQALPFYANDVASTALTLTVLFGLPVVARRLVESWRGAVARGSLLG